MNKGYATGRIPLLETIALGHVTCAKYLIQAGADVNIDTYHVMTPLTQAVHLGNERCLLDLIEAGADVNKATKSGFTPIIHAAYHGRPNCMDILIQEGADVNLPDKGGHTIQDYCITLTTRNSTQINTSRQCMLKLTRVSTD